MKESNCMSDLVDNNSGNGTAPRNRYVLLVTRASNIWPATKWNKSGINFLLKELHWRYAALLRLINVTIALKSVKNKFVARMPEQVSFINNERLVLPPLYFYVYHSRFAPLFAPISPLHTPCSPLFVTLLMPRSSCPSLLVPLKFLAPPSHDLKTKSHLIAFLMRTGHHLHRSAK